MTHASFVEEASDWADALARHESRRPGDYDNAMRRVADRIGIGYATLWGLRYRQPKRVFADIYFGLKAAYEAMREAQLQALELEIAEAKATGACPAYLDTAAAVAREARAVVND